MRLAEFLRTECEAILAEAAAHARTIPALRAGRLQELRDHLPQMLDAIARDLEAPQTSDESIEKSQGAATRKAGESAAQVHGRERARSGGDIAELAGEYRSLRASVLRLWSAAAPPDGDALTDMTRFNEAIDQALAESLEFHVTEQRRWRAIFLAVLGHDLRGPLNAIALGTEMVGRDGIDLRQVQSRLARGTKRMTSLIDSMLEFAVAGLGQRMPIVRVPVDLAAACTQELSLLRVVHPGVLIDFRTEGDANGSFDGARVQQALHNLVNNAVAHGGRSMVAVRLRGHLRQVVLEVTNGGSIDHDDLNAIFDPLQRGRGVTPDRSGHLGLGLFVVREVARAHGGDVDVFSSSNQVTFAMRLPKQTGDDRE